MKKIIGIIAGIFGILLAVIGIRFKYKKAMSVSIIGGADGPTSIFLAGKVGTDFAVVAIIIGIILLGIAVFLFLKNRH